MVTLKLILVFFRTACFNFMLNHMDVNNCMGLLHIAERLDCKVGIEIIVICNMYKNKILLPLFTT